jgi:hypothetical protein
VRLSFLSRFDLLLMVLQPAQEIHHRALAAQVRYGVDERIDAVVQRASRE